MDFLAAQNLDQYNPLGLLRNLTVVEKILVPGDQLFVWGEVIIYENQKALKPKLISDQSRASQMLLVMVFVIMGGIFLLVGLGMSKQAFL